MEDQNILIDQLEDKLIDNPLNGNSFGDVDLDKSFQNQLNERASQIGNEAWSDSSSADASTDDNPDLSSYDFLFAKPKLEYTACDVSSLKSELSQWFTTADFQALHLDTLHLTPEFDFDKSLHIDPAQESEQLKSLTYYCLGSFASSSSEEAQLRQIKENCSTLLGNGKISEVVSSLKQCFEEYINVCKTGPDQPITASFDSNCLQLMTILYFTLNCALQSSVERDSLLIAISQHKLSATIVQLCDNWGAQHNPRVRVRYSLMLLSKLLLFEFGGAERMQEADEYLVSKYDIRNKEKTKIQNKDLVCSRLDYFTYREDIYDKFPLTKNSCPSFENACLNSMDESEPLEHHPTIDHLDQHQESFMAVNNFSRSLSNSMNNPRTNKVHSVYSNLPAQAVHIATPIPSPPSTPSEFMSGGEKVRRLYHVNQGMPYIYPYDEGRSVPEAIVEAQALLEDSVYDSYSMKRFFHERELFMKQERGTSNELKNDLKTKLGDSAADSDPRFQAAIKSLESVETFYADSVAHLRGLVNVLVGIIKSSKIDVSLRDIEYELDPLSSFSKKYGAEKGAKGSVQGLIFNQLETIRAKEITLKAASSVLVLLMKWFKLSHVMKQNFLSCLLFDANYFNVFVSFLADSFNNPCLQNTSRENKNIQVYDVISSQNRLMNPMIDLSRSDFFKFCQNSSDTSYEGMTLIKKDLLTKLPFAIDGTHQNVISRDMYNTDFCTILANLLYVTNKVLIKNVSQRILVFNETKPTDLLKLILLNYVNDELRLPILKLFKKLTPCQGRKWRSVNMDVISLIYLHLKLSLRDNWLSGKDLENDFNSSYEQEVSLRSLLQFYHMRKYPKSMAALGYALQA